MHCAGLLATALSLGCGSHVASYEPPRLMQHRVHRQLDADLNAVNDAVSEWMLAQFGPPDRPKWPESMAPSTAQSLLSETDLDRAAGPVRIEMDRIERGLYRKHCATCHGVTGDGVGPSAALLAPYPRDFRRGTFKFKSTAFASKPTLDDLARTIRHGVAGTSMPAMANLERAKGYDRDIEILAGYVRYLAIRGEVERRIFLEAVPDLDTDAQPAALRAAIDSAAAPLLERVVGSWQNASSDLKDEVPSSKEVPEPTSEHIERGRIVFRSEAAACAQCHGLEGVGDGKLVDFDEWTKDWTIRAGIDPKIPSQWRPLKALGLLKPVPARPRNLRWGAYRGHGDPRTAVRRAIELGIEGSPMPAAARAASTPGGLTDQQLDDLIEYVLWLGKEGAS